MEKKRRNNTPTLEDENESEEDEEDPCYKVVVHTIKWVSRHLNLAE